MPLPLDAISLEDFSNLSINESIANQHDLSTLFQDEDITPQSDKHSTIFQDEDMPIQNDKPLTEPTQDKKQPCGSSNIVLDNIKNEIVNPPAEN